MDPYYYQPPPPPPPPKQPWVSFRSLSQQNWGYSPSVAGEYPGHDRLMVGLLQRCADALQELVRLQREVTRESRGEGDKQHVSQVSAIWEFYKEVLLSERLRTLLNPPPPIYLGLLLCEDYKTLTDFGLSMRARQAIRRYAKDEGKAYLSELRGVSLDEWQSLNNCGKTTAQELVEFFANTKPGFPPAETATGGPEEKPADPPAADPPAAAPGAEQ